MLAAFFYGDPKEVRLALPEMTTGEKLMYRRSLYILASLCLMATTAQAETASKTATSTDVNKTTQLLNEVAELRLKIADENKRHLEAMSQLREQLEKKMEEANAIRETNQAKREDIVRSKLEQIKKDGKESSEKKATKTGKPDKSAAESPSEPDDADNQE